MVFAENTLVLNVSNIRSWLTNFKGTIFIKPAQCTNFSTVSCFSLIKEKIFFSKLSVSERSKGKMYTELSVEHFDFKTSNIKSLNFLFFKLNIAFYDLSQLSLNKQMLIYYSFYINRLKT